MSKNYLFTSESVSEGHPDKLADQISDAILDSLLTQDPASRVAVETLITTGQVHVAGEVTTSGYADVMGEHIRAEVALQPVGKVPAHDAVAWLDQDFDDRDIGEVRERLGHRLHLFGVGQRADLEGRDRHVLQHGLRLHLDHFGHLFGDVNMDRPIARDRDEIAQFLRLHRAQRRQLGAGLAAVDIVEAADDLRARLFDNARYWRAGLEAIGFRLLPGAHPIVPVMLGDAKLAQDFAARALELGVYVIGFSFPVVPRGQARIRTQMSAAHTFEQIDQTVAAFTTAGKELGVI